MEKIKILFILFSCSIYFLCKGFARKKILEPNTILIVQTAKLGDMICTTPVFKAVKERYPKSKLLVMGNRINSEILEHDPFIDEYLTINGSFSTQLKVLKSEKIDVACLIMPHFKYLAMLYLAGVKSLIVPEIVGIKSPYETISYKILKKVGVCVRYEVGRYVPGEYLKLLLPLGIKTTDTTKQLVFSNKAVDTVEDFFNQNHLKRSDFIVIISPSVGNKIKRWGEQKFAEIAEYVRDRYHAKVIVIGGPRDRDEVTKMFKHIRDTRDIINSLEKFNLDELKAMISQVKLFISVDTGPVYIAEAFKVPIVDIIGPVHELEQPPREKRHFLVYDKNRADAALHIFSASVYDYAEAIRQIEAISVDDVKRAIDDIISRNKINF